MSLKTDRASLSVPKGRCPIDLPGIASGIRYSTETVAARCPRAAPPSYPRTGNVRNDPIDCPNPICVIPDETPPTERRSGIVPSIAPAASRTARTGYANPRRGPSRAYRPPRARNSFDHRDVPCSSRRRYRKLTVAPSWSDTVSGAATTDPSATLAEPPTMSRVRQPMQIAASEVSGEETYRLPSYSVATRSDRKLRHRRVASVAPNAAARCSVDTTCPVLSIPTSDQELDADRSSVGLPSALSSSTNHPCARSGDADMRPSA